MVFRGNGYYKGKTLEVGSNNFFALGMNTLDFGISVPKSKHIEKLYFSIAQVTPVIQCIKNARHEPLHKCDCGFCVNQRSFLLSIHGGFGIWTKRFGRYDDDGSDDAY